MRPIEAQRPTIVAYNANDLWVAMIGRMEVTIRRAPNVSSNVDCHTGYIMGIALEDGSGEKFLVKFHNTDKPIYVTFK